MRLEEDCFLTELEERIEQLPADECADARAWLYDIAERCGLVEETIDDLAPRVRQDLDALLAAAQPFRDRQKRLIGRYLVFCAFFGPAFGAAALILLGSSLAGAVPIVLTSAFVSLFIGGVCVLVGSLVVVTVVDRSYGRDLRAVLDRDPTLLCSLQVADQVLPDEARSIRSLARLSP